MSLADAFEGMPPKRTVEATENKGQHAKPVKLSAEARKRIAEEMKRRWKERAQAPRHSGSEALKRSGAQVPKRSSAEAPTPLPLQGTAKSKHPEFEPVKVYLRKATRKAAQRKAEDAGDGDFSELVERLLQEYLGA